MKQEELLLIQIVTEIYCNLILQFYILDSFFSSTIIDKL